MHFDSVQDSGERQQWDTGSQRDSQAGKGRFDLIPFYPIERLAIHFENGAKKYGDDNWKLGQPLSQYVNSAMRHVFKMAEGWTDEDHPAALMWNAQAFMWTKNEIDHGRLPAELDDIKWDDGGSDFFNITTLVEAWDGTAIRVDTEGVATMPDAAIWVGGPVDDEPPVLPEVFVAGDKIFALGDLLNADEMEMLPIGAVVRLVSRQDDIARIKRGPQKWEHLDRPGRFSGVAVPRYLEYLPD